MDILESKVNTPAATLFSRLFVIAVSVI